MIEKEKHLETEGYLRCLCNDSSMLICRYFLNHDQDGSGESILFSKGRRVAMQMRWTIHSRSLKTFMLVPYVCLYLGD